MPTTNVGDNVAVKILDEAAGHEDGAAGASYQVRTPRYVSIEGIAATNAIEVQAKLHSSAAWQVLQNIGDTNPTALLTFDNPPAFVRVVRTAGPAGLKVFAQR